MPLASTGEFHMNDTDDAVRETFTKPTGTLGTVHITPYILLNTGIKIKTSVQGLTPT